MSLLLFLQVSGRDNAMAASNTRKLSLLLIFGRQSTGIKESDIVATTTSTAMSEWMSNHKYVNQCYVIDDII